MTGHINDVIELPSLKVKTSKVKYWWFHFQQADRQSNWGWNFSFSFWFDFDVATLASNVQSAQWTGEIDTLPLLLTWYCLSWAGMYWSEIASMVTWENKQRSQNLSVAKTEGKPIVSICFWPFCPAFASAWPVVISNYPLRLSLLTVVVHLRSYILLLGHIIFTNIFGNLDKYLWQFGQIYQFIPSLSPGCGCSAPQIIH